MAIRYTTSFLVEHVPEPDGSPGAYVVVAAGCYVPLARTNTRAEAEQAKRALENVAAPRFTRDEAIAFCKEEALDPLTVVNVRDYMAGARAVLEALAAAGLFHDGKNMADKLDAAGIR